MTHLSRLGLSVTLCPAFTLISISEHFKNREHCKHANILAQTANLLRLSVWCWLLTTDKCKVTECLL